MRIYLGTFLIVTLMILSLSTAVAKTDKCTRVNTIARIGLPDGTRYVQEDGARDEVTGGPYCSFSIDGVAANSPSLERVSDAYKRLTNGDVDQNEQFLTDIGYIMISASHLTEPPDDLLSILDQGQEQISSCFAAFFSKEQTEGRLGFDGGFCQVTFEGSLEDETIIATEQPPSLVLHVRIEDTDVNRWAFIPIRF